jgi:hypothetical protein
MAEPTSTTAAGVAIAAGTITLTGTIFGVHYDALLGGFFGGLVSLSYLPAATIWRIAGSVGTSSILAGFFAPIAAAAGSNYFPWVAGLGDFTRIAAAVVIGLVAHAAIPAALKKIQSFGGAQ